MTADEARMIVECEIRTRWMTWKPSPQMVEDLVFAIKPYDNRDDVVNGIKSYRNSNSGTSPKVDALVSEIKKAVGSRKKNEHNTGPEWPGQVFVVIHHAADGDDDGIWHWHIGDYRKEVPYERQSFVMDEHIHYCKTRFSDRYPAGGHFSGEVHNEESFSKRLREVNLQMSSPETKRRVAEVEERLFNGEAPRQVFNEMFKVIDEKVKVPFQRRARTDPTMPFIEPPSTVPTMSNMFDVEGQYIGPERPSEEIFRQEYQCDPVEELIHDDPVEVPATPEPAPKPKKENPKNDWLDKEIPF